MMWANVHDALPPVGEEVVVIGASGRPYSAKRVGRLGPHVIQWCGSWGWEILGVSTRKKLSPGDNYLQAEAPEKWLPLTRFSAPVGLYPQRPAARFILLARPAVSMAMLPQEDHPGKSVYDPRALAILDRLCGEWGAALLLGEGFGGPNMGPAGPRSSAPQALRAAGLTTPVAGFAPWVNPTYGSPADGLGYFRLHGFPTPGKPGWGQMRRQIVYLGGIYPGLVSITCPTLGGLRRLGVVRQARVLMGSLSRRTFDGYEFGVGGIRLDRTRMVPGLTSGGL